MNNHDALHVLTIGHSTHALDHFLELLRRHDVTAIADVRSAPYSRRQPQFNKDSLQATLADAGIAYVFLGRELGGRSDNPSLYTDGRVQYARLAATEQFRSGVERVQEGATEFNLALMCAESEPLNCHRALLVAWELSKGGIQVAHILADGHLERHEDTMKRLLRQVGLQADLFRTEGELIEEAIARQAKRVAHVDRQLREEERARR